MAHYGSTCPECTKLSVQSLALLTGCSGVGGKLLLGQTLERERHIMSKF